MVGLTRRRFLGAAGAALGGALLAGCGAEEEQRSAATDADVLAELLAHEQRALAAVHALPGAEAIARQDREHVARLAALAGVAALDPTTAPGGDPLAPEQDALFAQIEALPRLADADLRVLVMRIAASDAGHLAALRLGAGEEPVPDAFAGYTLEPMT